MAKLIIPLK